MLLLANTIFFVFVLWPEVSLTNQLGQREDEASSTRLLARRASAARDADASARLSAAGRVALAERRLVSENDLPALSDRIRNLAAKAGLEPIRIDYRTTHFSGRPYDSLEIELVARGPYRGVKWLLWALERAETAMAVSSLAVSGSEDSLSGPAAVKLVFGTLLLPDGRRGGEAEPGSVR